MPSQSILAIACLILILAALPACERQAATSPVSSGPFTVNSDTGVATGEALGITFRVMGATGAEATSEVSGSPQSASRAEITLAEDLKIGLETMAGGDGVALQVNGKRFGLLAKGDEVAIDQDRAVKVNGEARTEGDRPAKAAQP